MSDDNIRQGVREVTECARRLLPLLAEHPVEQAQIRMLTALFTRHSPPDYPIYMDRLLTLLKPFAKPGDMALWEALKDDSECCNAEKYARAAREMMRAILKLSEVWTLN